MNLYVVECVYNPSVGLGESYSVYVVASNSTTAEKLAMERMKLLKYKYTDFVKSIDIVASVDEYKAERILVIE